MRLDLVDLAGFDYINELIVQKMDQIGTEKEEKSKEKSERDLLITYITDALKIIGGLNVRFEDWKHPKPAFTKTPDEIYEGIEQRLAKLRGDRS